MFEETALKNFFVTGHKVQCVLEKTTINGSSVIFWALFSWRVDVYDSRASSFLFLSALTQRFRKIIGEELLVKGLEPRTS